IPRLALERNRPGPALLRKGTGLPFSADVHWSVSDEFKSRIAIDRNDPRDRVRMQGYNYVNVALHCMRAMGDIFAGAGEKNRAELAPDHVELITKFAKHAYPDLRGTAADTLGKMGVASSLKALDELLKAEKDTRGRVLICTGILRS